jgi:hypothetical protein
LVTAGIIQIVAVALTVVLSAPPGAQATPTLSAAALMKLALSDATSRSSVHEMESQKSAKFSATLSADLGTNDGRQDITRSGGEQAHVLLIGSAAYISGNQAALIHYYGLPVAVARKVGTRWVSVPSSSSGYPVIATGATLSSAIKALAIPGHVTETAPTSIDGQPAFVIHGKSSVTGSSATVSVTMYVSRGATPLPLSATFTYSSGGTVTVQLSDWNERLALRAPTNVIPLAQLQK